MTGPLDGLRVTDFTWVVAGPFCTKTLADMGAEVIKIEARNRPDPMRNYLNRNGIDNPYPYGVFDNFNRNKMGISVNARHPEGLKLLHDLIAVSDAVTENFRGGVLDRWGLTYDTMREVRPDIIYLSLSGYGQSGPYSSYACHYHIAQAIPGYTHLSGYEDDVPVVSGSWGDTTSGLHAAAALGIALEHRSKTGRGQRIDAAMITSIANVMGPAYIDYTANGHEACAGGNRLPYPQAYLEGAFRCKGDDRWVAIGVYTEDEWGSFCKAISRPDLFESPLFANECNRLQHIQELEAEVEKWTKCMTAEDAMHVLQATGIGAAVVENIQDMMERDDQLRARGFYVDAWHPDRAVGTLRMDGVVPKFSNTPGEVRRAAPMISEHTEYVFGEILGLSYKRLNELNDAGVFF